jgi:hypothetical protein
MFSSGVNNAGVCSLDTAREYLARGRDKSRRPLPGKATSLVAVEGGIAVRYHETDVVTYREDGTVEIRFGGWQTPTTRQKIGAFARARVWSAGKGYSEINGVKVRESATLRPDGTVEGDHDPAQETREKKHRARIKAFAQNFADDFLAGNVPPPSGGDCWYCHLFGDAGGGDHLREHIEEGYHVPSLLARAAQKNNYLTRFVLPAFWASNTTPEFKARTAGDRYAKAGIVKALRAEMEARCPAP